MPSFLDLVFRWLGHTRHNTVAPTVADGNTEELQCDVKGALRVTAKPAGSYTRPTELASSGIIHTAPCRLVELHAVSESSEDRYLQLFDGTVLPEDGTAPYYAVKIPTGGVLSMTFDVEFAFTSGLVWCLSSTLATKNIAADEAWVSVWTVLLCRSSHLL